MAPRLLSKEFSGIAPYPPLSDYGSNSPVGAATLPGLLLFDISLHWKRSCRQRIFADRRYLRQVWIGIKNQRNRGAEAGSARYLSTVVFPPAAASVKASKDLNGFESSIKSKGVYICHA